MNPIKDFLFFNPDLVNNIDSSFVKGAISLFLVIHTIAWFFVLTILPFKILSWMASNKKES